MYYTYLLKSLKDKKNYTGYTSNLEQRLAEHNAGKVTSTKHRGPFQLIYFEACLHKKDAIKRENYFKTHYGRMFLKKRLASFYQEPN